jgi:hypothetical protein
MKIDKSFYIITVILISILIFIGYNYFYQKNTYNYYANCCLSEYSGILFYNDCISENCPYKNNQLGWTCEFRENETERMLPVRLLNCSN